MKALALTGAFGIIATVPVIVSSCSSTSENNGGSGNGGTGDNQGGGGSGGGTTDTQKVTPKLKSSINLVGALKDIYNPASGKTTKDLLAQEIKNNPSLAFEDSEKLNGKNFDVSVEATFSRSSWTDKTYDTEKKTMRWCINRWNK
ncbi:P35 lipoprotein homolog fragment [Malacoplasma penetrans HF-2]|uniref:P35 lipoprotein homolog n=1 Tax=Malacoplasma penetrans (strain HF-2) TaxID=272633 RepID=Q8EV28_MALP2|nr:P35 lipoprotein homolog fragment [Malacoplasma penetrans HF-2]